MLKKFKDAFTGTAKLVIFTAVVLIIVAVVLPNSRAYLNGELAHYKGESTVTAEQGVYLAAVYNVGYSPGRNGQLTIREGGMVDAKYDFYGENGLGYLYAEPFSYRDIPSFYLVASSISGDWAFYLSLLLIFAVFIILVATNRLYVATRAIYNLLWYLLHLDVFFRSRPEPAAKSRPNIIKQISVDTNRSGIYAVRTWKYANGILHSVVAKNSAWGGKIIYADKIPGEKNESGLHAYRLGTIKDDYPCVDDILGIVTLDGECSEHADCVIRAERAEILTLILNRRYGKIAESLSAAYGVPVYLADKPKLAYQQWVLSKNGIECMAHNAEVLNQEVSV